MKSELEKRPKVEYLWGGIKEKSFGLVFGPSKSGKTIFSENLAMSLAVGRDSFFGKKLSGKPKKVFFIGLEEFWEIKTSDLIEALTKKLSIQERQLKNYLKQLVNEKKIINTEKGYYISSECTDDGEEVSDEK